MATNDKMLKALIASYGSRAKVAEAIGYTASTRLMHNDIFASKAIEEKLVKLYQSQFQTEVQNSPPLSDARTQKEAPSEYEMVTLKKPDEEQIHQMVEKLYKRLDRLDEQREALVKAQKQLGHTAKKPKVIRAYENIKIRIRELEEAIDELVDAIRKITDLLSPIKISKDLLNS
ncbi:hypothetical protein WDW89_05255 [Deltaproteobacteria bacterium TL4]